VRAAVADTRGQLEHTGPTLVDVAKNYQTTDEQCAEILRQIDLMLPPVLAEPELPAQHRAP
jgi:hypothetical protein